MPESPASYEVIIAGGGPAGSACAAAILGRRPDLAGRVLILDRARHPREKPCGGGLTGHVPGAMAALGLSLAVPAVDSAAAQVVFGKTRRRVALPQPVRVVRREEFDESLLQQAAARGAEVRQGEGLRDFTIEGGAVTVRAGAGPALRAKVLVGADGAGSLVRKRLLGHRARAAPRPLRLFRAELPLASPIGDEMVYDFTPMQEGLRGYVWLFPVPGGRCNVGVMHYPEPGGASLSGAQLAALCARHLGRYGVEVPEGSLRGWPAWGYDPSLPLSAPHLCLVGDAAGVDALTGEGIAVALEQGEVAGAAICDGLRGGDLRLTGYRRAVRRAAVGRELALDRRLAWLLYSHRPSAGDGGRGGEGWRRWLGMVLYDDELLELYARRVAGQLVLADQRLPLLRVLLRHLPAAQRRRAQLEAALAA